MKGIKSFIKGIKDDGNTALAHLFQRNGDTGLKVFTIPLKEQDVQFTFASNDEVGFEMAIDGSFGGTPEVIHNGIDSVEWLGSNIVGAKVTFNSTEQKHSGSNSVKVNKANVGNIWQFYKGSNLTLSAWQAFSLWIYVESGWTVGDSFSFYGYDTGTGLQVGDAVNLADHFNELDFGVWQKLSIPLTEMNLETGTIDALRMECTAKSGAGVVFYVDDMQVEETSGLVTFKIEAPQGTKFIIDQFRFTFIDALSTTLIANSMPNISYNKILGLSKLDNGIGFSRLKNGEIVFNAVITCLADSTRGGAMLENVFSDGTNTHVTLATSFREAVTLDSRFGDNIAVTVQDDLSDLISFTAVALGKTQQIT